MRKRVGVFLMVAAAVPLAAASVAWACGVLATLTLDKRVAAPGDAVSATGKNYGTAAGVSAVSIRLKSRSGTVLTSTAPSATGKIATTFALPSNLSPGWYVVLATQNNANGTPKSGTPGRTTLRVQGSANSAVPPPATPWGPSSPPSGPTTAPVSVSNDGGQPLSALLLAGVLSVAMLAGGWMLVTRKGRGTSEPQLTV